MDDSEVISKLSSLLANQTPAANSEVLSGSSLVPQTKSDRCQNLDSADKHKEILNCEFIISWINTDVDYPIKVDNCSIFEHVHDGLLYFAIVDTYMQENRNVFRHKRPCEEHEREYNIMRIVEFIKKNNTAFQIDTLALLHTETSAVVESLKFFHKFFLLKLLKLNFSKALMHTNALLTPYQLSLTPNLLHSKNDVTKEMRYGNLIIMVLYAAGRCDFEDLLLMNGKASTVQQIKSNASILCSVLGKWCPSVPLIMPTAESWVLGKEDEPLYLWYQYTLILRNLPSKPSLDIFDAVFLRNAALRDGLPVIERSATDKTVYNEFASDMSNAQNELINTLEKLYRSQS